MRWKYDAADPGRLNALDLDLEPGQEFDAPDDWLPEPNPHPVYKPVSDNKPPAKSAPAQAPEQE